MIDGGESLLTIMNGQYLLGIKHGVLENGPFISNFPIETCVYRGFFIAMFDYQRVMSYNGI